MIRSSSEIQLEYPEHDEGCGDSTALIRQNNEIIIGKQKRTFGSTLKEEHRRHYSSRLFHFFCNDRMIHFRYFSLPFMGIHEENQRIEYLSSLVFNLAG